MRGEWFVYMAAGAVVWLLIADEVREIRQWYKREKSWKRRMKDVW